MSENKVFILGGYQTDFARNWNRENKHIVAMMREAYQGSLVDTNVTAEDIKAAFVGNFTGELYCTQGHLGAFFVELDPAFKGMPTSRLEGACGSGSLAALSAMAYIQAGIYDCVCVMGVEQMKTVSPSEGATYLGTAAWFEREAKDVDFPFPKLFGQLGDEYDKRYGIDDKYLARIADINYSNARRNPNAQTRDWYMNYEHANSVGRFNTIVDGRIRVTDCSQITDGAVCLYLASEKFANEYAVRSGIDICDIPSIHGWGHTTDSIEYSQKVHDSANNEYILPVTRKAILEAFSRAKINDCWELDAIETHDCFTTSEYMAIDHFGLTDPGKSWQAIEDEIINSEGKLPINPSGGLIGCGHPVGATGVRQMLDAYKQVTNKAGDYQVENARKVATLNIGGTATTNVVFVIGK